MASVRLNKMDKEHIAKQARIKSPLHKQAQDIEEALRQFAGKLRVHVLGGEEKAAEYAAVAKKIAGIRASLPENLTCYGSTISMSNNLYVYFEKHKGQRVNLPDTAVAPNNSVNLYEYPELLKEFIGLRDLEKTTDMKLKNLENEVLASISSITTLKKLLSVWPEAEELIPEHLKQPPVQLPALRTAKLNKMIGLPSDKSKPTGAK